MSSRIEQATVALETLLSGIAGVTVERNRDIPADFVTETTPVLVLTDGDDEEGSPHFVAANVCEFKTQVVLSGFVTANDYAALGPARDALWMAAWKLITANRVLGSELTWDVLPGKTVRRLEDHAGKPVAVFELPVTLCLNAQINDPAIAA